MYNLKEEETTDWQELTQLFTIYTYIEEAYIIEPLIYMQYWHGQITVYVGNDYNSKCFMWEV